MSVQFILSDQFVVGSAVASILLVAVWIYFGGQGAGPDEPLPSARRRGRLSVATGHVTTSAETMLAGGDTTIGTARAVAAAGAGSGAGAGVGGRPASAKVRTERTFTTTHGPLRVLIDGDDSLDHDMVTVHDVGNNARTCFGAFFQLSSRLRPFDQMRVIHVCIPGQEEGAATLTAMPTMEHLAAMVAEVLDQMEIRRVVGFGVGAGANILLRLARTHTKLVDGIVCVGANRQAAGVAEQIYSRVLGGLLATAGLNTAAKTLIMDQHFSVPSKRRSCYRDHFEALGEMNGKNIGLFLAAYRARDEVTRYSMTEFNRRRIPVLCMAGPDSHGGLPLVPGPRPVPAALDLYASTDLTVSSWMKVTLVGDWVSLESPAELVQPMILFLRSFGYT